MLLTASVDAPHARSIEPEDALVPAGIPGTDGGVVSGGGTVPDPIGNGVAPMALLIRGNPNRSRSGQDRIVIQRRGDDRRLDPRAHLEREDPPSSTDVRLPFIERDDHDRTPCSPLLHVRLDHPSPRVMSAFVLLT